MPASRRSDLDKSFDDFPSTRLRERVDYLVELPSVRDEPFRPDPTPRDKVGDPRVALVFLNIGRGPARIVLYTGWRRVARGFDHSVHLSAGCALEVDHDVSGRRVDA